MKTIKDYNNNQRINLKSKSSTDFYKGTYFPKKIFYIIVFSLFLIYGCVPTSYYTQIDLSSGNNMYAAGKYDTAINYYSAVIKKDPNNTEAYRSRSLSYSKINKMKEAMTDIDKAISLDHKNWEFYYTRASLFEKQELYNQAIADYTTFVTKSDKKAGAPGTTKLTTVKGGNNNVTPYYLGYWGRGKCNFFAKKMNEAAEDFTQSIKYNPNDIFLFYWRGGCYFDQDKYQEAAKDYEIFLAKNPKYYQQQFQLGTCYFKMGEKEKAMYVYSKFAEYDPSIKTFFSGEHQLDFYDTDLRRKQARRYIEDANFNLDDSKSITSKSLLEISLTSAFEKLQLAWGYALNLNKDDKVILDTIVSKMYYIYPKLKVKPIIPEYVRRFTVQATSMVEEKNYNDAIEKYQLALGITPYYPFAHFNLAMLYSTTREYKKAIGQMNSYLKLAPDAADARAAQDKIYEWEIKVKD